MDDFLQFLMPLGVRGVEGVGQGMVECDGGGGAQGGQHTPLEG